jgi:hypothetical protein
MLHAILFMDFMCFKLFNVSRLLLSPRVPDQFPLYGPRFDTHQRDPFSVFGDSNLCVGTRRRRLLSCIGVHVCRMEIALACNVNIV